MQHKQHIRVNVKVDSPLLSIWWDKERVTGAFHLVLWSKLNSWAPLPENWPF